MASKAQTQKYPGVRNSVAVATSASGPVLVADFKTVDFSIVGGGVLSYTTLVGAFVIGEIVTSSSGGTGRIAFDNGTNRLYITNIAGTFLNTNTLLGTSGATAVLTANIATANFTIGAFISNQELPPNPYAAASPANEYSPCAYMDLTDDTTWTNGTPYNPTGVSEFKMFEAQLDGARWFFTKIITYTSGALVSSDMSLFSNYS